MIERKLIASEAEWLTWRKADVTASTIAALFGRHPYTTALHLHLEKRGVDFARKPDNRVTRRGRWLEPAVAKAVGEQRPDWRVIPAGVYLRDPDLRLGATPDFFIDANDNPRGFCVLQTKTCAPSVFERDWDEGRELPFWIKLQVMVEMMLADAAFGFVGALVVDPYAMDVHLIEVVRDKEIEAEIVEAVQKFWADVEAGREPPADLARDSDAIRELTRREQAGKELDLAGANELPIILAQRAALMARIKNDEARCEEIENEIKLTLGDAERGVGLDGWRITFKTTERAGYQVPPKSIRSLRIYDRRPAHERPDGGEDQTQQGAA